MLFRFLSKCHPAIECLLTYVVMILIFALLWIPMFLYVERADDWYVPGDPYEIEITEGLYVDVIPI